VDSEPEPDQLPDREYYISTQSAAGSMDAFESMLTSVANTPGITTGFSKLDKLLDGGLYPGLVILGAVTSVGKTTVGMQLMDQIAKDGQRDVMIFSLEMSKYELMARSISRESFLNDRNNPLTVRDVLDGRRFAQFSEGKLANFLEAKGQYKIYAKRIFIYEGLGNINVFFIRRMIENHTKITGLPPVVLIDYIQLLAPKDVRMTDKQAVDYNVMALKQISRDFSIPVIGISSLNRASYSKNNQNGGQNGAGKVALESFKESGAIEYSSDILIGLNRNSDDNTGKAMMELDILKNRNGIKDIAADFEYYYKYNYFREI
jgi:replicative DNA helicase